eukprot:TRINITY_DN8832_c1_g2_i1.p1 TRINITY_DN8832_c1_g2~~TRINITY_DN8832_c1_g2_i1.p1  ORF type:complete len:451 (+),score=80.82 TRINITY_DN8832_c1_g2_i1:85-1437(+)
MFDPSGRVEKWADMAMTVMKESEWSYEDYWRFGGSSSDVGQIKLDLPRTPLSAWGSGGATSTELREALGGVLQAWVGYSSRERYDQLPYVQGMSLIAVVPVCVFSANPEYAFWIFYLIMTRILSPHCFGSSPPLVGHRADTTLLQEIARKKLPKLLQKIKEVEFNEMIALLSTKWLLPVFTSALPEGSVLALWDSLLETAFDESSTGHSAISSGLASTPLFVWAIAILQSVESAALPKFDDLDPDIPISVQAAGIISKTARSLPKGFQVSWTDVPGFSAEELAMRHEVIRNCEIEASKKSGQKWSIKTLFAPAIGKLKPKKVEHQEEEEEGDSIELMSPEAARMKRKQAQQQPAKRILLGDALDSIIKTDTIGSINGEGPLTRPVCSDLLSFLTTSTPQPTSSNKHILDMFGDADANYNPASKPVVLEKAETPTVKKDAFQSLWESTIGR